jgi:hypothetical protein
MILGNDLEMDLVNMNKVEMRVIENQIKQLKFELSNFEE